MRLKFLSFSNLTLLVALSLSSVAAYYSIIGLTAIFAGAVIPVIIMGGILEVGKITTTVWLRKYWNRASWVLKLYLVPAVVALALLTSMGIFGFLSKAHMDQGITSGDSQAKLALYDEKIKTQRDNIELARKALTQMDNQVDQRLNRGDSENSAERAVQIRRQQAGERAKLQKDIGEAQKEIAKLNEERAPIAAENRKIEAEVGPIKYIAALIYGDNADGNMLEAAVRWVIILLVIVFDPLAIALVLAANASKEWDAEEPIKEEPAYEPDDGPLTEKQIEQIKESVEEELPIGELVTKDELFPEPEKSILEQHPYLNQPFDHFKDLTPVVYKPDPIPEVQEEPKVEKPVKKTRKKPAPKKTPKSEPVIEQPIADIERPGDYITPPDAVTNVVTDGVTIENPLQKLEGGYVTFEGRHMSEEALKSLRPDLFRIQADGGRQVSTNFGTNFPKVANRGDIFVRVDMLPNRVYKFDGRSKWIEVNKDQTDSYLHDQKYVEYLVSMIETGQYDLDLLSDTEKEQISEYLSSNKP
jgi:hypothetical protein